MYDYIENFLACAGSILYVGVKDGATEAQAYPVDVKNVTNTVIGSAGDKQSFLNIWNADTDNQAVGVLSGAYGPFLFELKLKCDINPSILTPIFVVPPQTIISASVTFASGATVLLPMVRLVQFKVGAPGAPMTVGDDTYTNSALAGKHVLVLASGMGLPNDETGTGTGFDPNDRWSQKTISSDTVTINNGVADGEIIEVYAY